MVTLVKNIPDIYNQVASEEYYLYYQFQNDNTLKKEITRDDSLIKSINVVQNKEQLFSFLLSFDDEEELKAITRIFLSKESLNTLEIVYINPLSDKEKAIILTEIINKLENLALIFSQEINISLPINDDISISILNCLGYNTIDSDNKKTIIFNKKEEKRSLNGQTLSRKQRKRFNKSRCNK